MYRIEALGEIVPEFAASSEAIRQGLKDPKVRGELRSMVDSLPDDVRGELFDAIGCSSAKGTTGKLVLVGAGGAVLGVLLMAALRG